MKALPWFVAGITVVFLSLGLLEARTWTSADNSKTLEGEYVSSDGTTVEIKLANGQTLKAALSAFSKADQDFVAAQATPGSPTEPTAAAAPAKPGDLEPAKFEIWKARLCCNKAEKAYEDAVKQVEGVTFSYGKNSLGDKVIVLDAKTKVAARAALEKIAEVGFYGETDSHEVKFASPVGKAQANMTATGVVFCCNESVDALENAMKRARGEKEGEKGVAEHTIKKSNDTFEIKGTATASEVLRHARDAGFNFTLENTGAAPQ